MVDLLIEITLPPLLNAQTLDLTTKASRNDGDVGAVVVRRGEGGLAAGVGGLEDGGRTNVASVERANIVRGAGVKGSRGCGANLEALGALDRERLERRSGADLDWLEDGGGWDRGGEGAETEDGEGGELHDDDGVVENGCGWG